MRGCRDLPEKDGNGGRGGTFASYRHRSRHHRLRDPEETRAARPFQAVAPEDRRFSGSSSIATPAEAPTLLPIPEAPVNCEGENTENNLSDMPGDFHLPIFDPVFQDVQDAVENVESGAYLISCKK